MTTPAPLASAEVSLVSTPALAGPHLPSDSPYKGLTPYTADDTAFFFGRDQDTEIIKANLMTARLTLLYGASGVGKSSVLQAGVVHALNVQAQRDLEGRGVPRALVVHFSRWRDPPIPALLQTIQETILRVLPVEAPRPSNLTDTLRAWTERTHGDLLLILDQFEEYFLYHQNADGEGTFANEFPRALKEADLRVNFLLAFREDGLAQLDRFKGRVPNLFKNMLRVRHLDRDAACGAIVKPIQQYNNVRATDAPEMQIEPALVDAVLDQVRVGKVVIGESGRGVLFDAPTGDEIETPYLQLVMVRLWEAELAAGSNALRLQTLTDLGGAEAIVRAHLDAALKELSPQQQATAARIFDRLVTPSGAKISLSLLDLVAYAEVPEAKLRPILDGLASGSNRILREEHPPDQPDNPHYEIFHDVLARAVLGWSTRYEQEQQLLDEQARLQNALYALSPEQQAIAARIFGVLVTPSGAKIAMSVRDLVAYAEVPEAELQPVLDSLAGSIRILRQESPPDQPDVPQYKIFPDMLAPAVLDWSARYEEAQRRREERTRLEVERRTAEHEAQSARRMAEQAAQSARRSRIVAVLLGVALVIVVLSILGWAYLVPTQMPDGALNVAIANFGEVDANGNVTSSERGAELSALLSSQMQNSPYPAATQPVTVWQDGMNVFQKRATIGFIRNPAEAAKVANDLNADIVLYGILEGDQDALSFEPHVYVNQSLVAAGTGVAELTGNRLWGKPMPLTYPLNPAYLELELMPRMNAVIWFLHALAFDALGDFDSAYQTFCEADQALRSWQDFQGKETLYHFLGQEALKLAASDELARETLKLPAAAWGTDCKPFENASEAEQAAETWFTTALMVDPNYADAYSGLAGVHTIRAQKLLQAASSDNSKIQPVRQELIRALELLPAALSQLTPTPGSPSSLSDLQLKTQLTLGSIYSLFGQTYLMESDWKGALENLDRAEAVFAPLIGSIPPQDSRLLVQTYLALAAAQRLRAQVLEAQRLELANKGGSPQEAADLAARARGAYLNALDSVENCLAIANPTTTIDYFLIGHILPNCEKMRDEIRQSLANVP